MNFKNKGDKMLGPLNGPKNNYSSKGAVSAHLKEVKKIGNQTRRNLDRFAIEEAIDNMKETKLENLLWGEENEQ